MRALVTNDDGIDSPGLHALAQVAADAGLDVLVAAPRGERSGAGASLAAVLDEGRVVVVRSDRGPTGIDSLAVEAAPAFIVQTAMAGAFGDPPDIVLSGINRGPNTGHAILHSGTVGAAFTAATYGRRALAVSAGIDGPHGLSSAVTVAGPALQWLLQAPDATVLNVNVPGGPGPVRGIRKATLAPFGAVEALVAERGEGWVEMRYEDVRDRMVPGTDAALIADGYATVTVLLAVQEDPDVDLGPLESWTPPERT